MCPEDNFNQIMHNSKYIALATAVDNVPNVRVLNFIYDPKVSGCIYIFTNPEDAKISEFSKNPQVAFTTFDDSHIRVKSAQVQKSMRPLSELENELIRKEPDYEHILKMMDRKVAIYEIVFNEADVICDMELKKLTFV